MHSASHPIVPHLNASRRAWLVAVLGGIVAGVVAFVYHVQFARGAGDMTWPLCAARALVAGAVPYAECTHMMSSGQPGPTNPMTTALFLLPFIALPDETVVSLVLGLSTLLLVLALLQHGEWWRLLALSSLPFLYALVTGQWSPLLLAVALLPSTLLYPLTMLKPQLGLPIALLQFGWLRAAICVAILALLLLIYPTWPLDWLNHTGTYDGGIPLLVLPGGPLLLLALLRWRTPRARWLLLYALMPQRVFYDQLLLFLVIQTQREMLLFVVLTWLAFFGWFFTQATLGLPGIGWVVHVLYLFCLVCVLRERPAKESEGKER